MSESKHTPGPWIAAHNEDDDNWSVYQYEKGMYGFGKSFICVEICQGYDRGKADAELIARAPSLLSELEQLRGENEKLKSDLKIMQELDAEHDKEWSASILKDARITDLCNENEKYRQALESILSEMQTDNSAMLSCSNTIDIVQKALNT